jgi:hypothetical protein
VTVNTPPSATDCNPNDAANPYVGNNEYLQVIIHSSIDTYFAPVIGIDKTSSCVEANARVTTGTYGFFGGGNGIMTLSQTGTGISWTGSAPANITGGIATNAGFSSTGSGNFTVTDGVRVNGNFSLTGSGDWNVANGVSINNNFSHTGSSDFIVTSGGFQIGGTASWVGSGTKSPWPPTLLSTPRPPDPDPLAAYVDPPANPGGCVAANYVGSTNITINPGCYTDISMVGSGNLTLNSGIYYVTGNISMTGSGKFTALGVMIYMQSGGISLTGSGGFNISPMTSGSYQGLTIYLDRNNTSNVSMTGSGSTSSSGTFYAPVSNITMTGSGGTTVIDSQIVCAHITLTGSGGIDLQYNGAHNYQIPSPPTIELTR